MKHWFSTISFSTISFLTAWFPTSLYSSKLFLSIYFLNQRFSTERFSTERFLNHHFFIQLNKVFLFLAACMFTQLSVANCNSCPTRNSCGDCGAGGCSTSDCSVRTFIPARSQGTSSVLDNVGIVQLYHETAQDNKHGIISVAAEYTNSFRPTSVSSALFGCDLVESNNYLQAGLSLNLSGSGIEDIQLDDTILSRNNTKDWLADYFLLPTDFSGQIHFTPRIQNVVADISWLAMGSEKLQGWYANLKLPIAFTKYDLSVHETIYQRGAATGYDPAITNSMTLNTFFDTSCNGQTVSFTNGGDAITQLPLSCSRICPCANTKSGLADLHLTIGYNYLQPRYFVGAYGRVIAPTGNRPTGELLFEPILGNGHHWELGGGATGQVVLWKQETDDKELSFVVDGSITHLFAASQVRVFDLKNKPWSRFILAKQFDANGSPTGLRSQVANLTSCPITTSYDFQTDIVAYFSYASETFTYDIGYNFWARSCEKLCRGTCSTTKNCCGSCRYSSENWGLGIITDDQTESASTIHENITMLGVPADTTNHYLTTDDISYDTTRTKSATHKLFMHLGYSWLEHAHPPFVGLGGEVEFGSVDSCNKLTVCAPGCSSCSHCNAVAISQWGIWLKGGVAF